MSDSYLGSDELALADDLYERGQYEEALERYRVLAQAGSRDARISIGRMYHMGRGIAQDIDEARQWYQPAADEESPLAQCLLGFTYKDQGRYLQAIEWFERSASQGYPPAMYALGRLYEAGEGVGEDSARAEGYFEQAAKMGHLLAQRQIAVGMLKGKRGIKYIPWGLCRFIQSLWEGMKLILNDSNSDRLRWLGI